MAKTDQGDSHLLSGKLPCPKCTSSDGYHLYSNGWGKCFACDANVPWDVALQSTEEAPKVSGLIPKGEHTSLNKRKINADTCALWDYTKAEYNGTTVQIANYKNDKGTTIAQKVRFPNKDFKFLGDTQNIPLYGQWLWKDGGKMVTLVEGEIDALSASQTQDNKWAVVSVPNGCQGAVKAVKNNLEWLLKFDTVVIMFDQDEVGQEAAHKVAELLPPRKAKIASLPLKDASEMLMAGRSKDLITAMWQAKTYTPAGIVSGSELRKRLEDRPEVQSYAWPSFMQGMNQKTYGIRLGELDVFTSGSGMGKTTLIKQLQHHFMQTTDLNQALIHLEEPLEETAEGLIGIHIGKRLNLPDVREYVADADYWKGFDETFGAVDADGNSRLNVYDAFGSLDETDLYNKVRYFATGLGCKVIWIDHLSILVSDLGSESQDERRAIDSIMHNLKMLTQELGVYIGLISHLKKAPQGRSFEEGYVPSSDDLRGSGSIKQLSNNVYAISRNQQEEDDRARNTSLLTVLKCRYTGRTGRADYLYFDEHTGRMVIGQDPDAAMVANGSN